MKVSCPWLAVGITLLSFQPLLVVSQAYLATLDDINSWLRDTAPAMEFVNGDWSTLPGPEDVRLVYCTERTGRSCGGRCIGYQGPRTQCLKTLFKDADCLAATHRIDMCNVANCTDCNQSDTCGTRMDYGFCWTPSTNSLNLTVRGGTSMALHDSVKCD